MSWFFLADLYFFDNHKGINPLAVLDEIYILEGLATEPTGTKEESQYKGDHLKGLWHKHYMSARFIAQNIQHTLGREGGGRLTEIIKKNVTELDFFDETAMYAAAERMSKEIVSDSFRMRKNNNKLTGEWIIFAKYDGENYYLCMSYHGEGDQRIANRIRTGCIPQFDFIKFGC